jgi:tetratricopeptide (TPR) repeat protein
LGEQEGRLSRLGAVALLWIVGTYFPHSNVLVLLPTIRAERFWYLPAIAAALLLGWMLSRLARLASAKGRRVGLLLACGYLGFQAVQSRLHAFDYNDDLAFWEHTAWASPMSAKAQLNYGVMLGARGRMQERLEQSRRAQALAPDWPMGNIYLGDVLCRLDRPDEALPHYRRGFELGPNDSSLIALALQCLWDKGAFKTHEAELSALANEHSGSWISYLVRDMSSHGAEHDGVDPKYRPRNYNAGPKKSQTKKDAKDATFLDSGSEQSSDDDDVWDLDPRPAASVRGSD